jgi:hypothetical protein
MKKKTKKRKLNYVYIVVLLSLMVISILLYVISLQRAAAAEYEKEMFMNLQSNMKSLKEAFSAIDSGWSYSEGCRGKGGVYERGEPSSCLISITNQSEDPSTLKGNFNLYERVLDTLFLNSVPQTTSEWSITNENDTRVHKSSGYSLKDDSEVTCTFSEFYSNDEPASARGGLTFSCNRPAAKFYFPRYDI